MVNKWIGIAALLLAVTAGSAWLVSSHAAAASAQMRALGCGGGSCGPSSSAAQASADTATCPVMGETKKKSDMIAYDHQGQTYYFCCPSCVTKFKAHPEKYTKPAAE